MIKRIKQLFCKHRALALRTRVTDEKTARHYGNCMDCGRKVSMVAYQQYGTTKFDLDVFVEEK